MAKVSTSQIKEDEIKEEREREKRKKTTSPQKFALAEVTLIRRY